MSDENGAKPRGLHSKLAEVMAEVGRVPKRGRNEFHKYDYATEADIVEAVRGALSARGVSLLPSVRQVLREGTLTTALMAFSFTDGETGETSTHEWAGTGDDKGDKGLYKAMTGALKYFLLKTFLLPTGDDPEADEATDKRAYGQPKPRKAAAVEQVPRCLKCGAPAMPGNDYCLTCDKLARQRREVDAAPAAVPVSTGKPPAKESKAGAAHKRAFVLMDKYGLNTASGESGKIDRRAIYGKALGLGRLATDAEVKAFSDADWLKVCAWLLDTYEPPLEEAPPLGVVAE